MSIALRHDRRLMPKQPLDLIEIHTGLNHPRREGMAKIMKMQILDFRALEGTFRAPPGDIERSRESVCYERNHFCKDGRDASPTMRGGPSMSTYRRRLQTAASGVDQESSS